MEMAMNELPLAIFTTLASIGAGAFISLFLSFISYEYTNDQYKAIDKLTIIPLLFVIVGFIASFFHLASPMHAFNAFNGIGSSPLSNEILVGIIFVVVAVIYYIAAVAGKLSFGARKGFSGLVAVIALVFAIMVGCAYLLPTVASWNTALTPIMMVGFALLGGAALGMGVLGSAGSLEVACKTSFKSTVTFVAVVGALCALIGFIAFYALSSGMSDATTIGGVAAGELCAFFVLALIFIILGAVCTIMAGMFGADRLAWIGMVLLVIGVFFARLVFYGMEIGIGL